MMIAQAVGVVEIIVVLVYMMVVAYLGWLGYRGTKTDADYLVAGRKVHPFVMALSYGATFISTSAIVGFGGVAGLFGMSLLWLTFLNIFVGIFVAFVFLGGPTRRLGHRLDAHTFPELLGRRFQSSFMQVFAGLIIFFFIPLYAAAVLIGGCEYISTQFGIPYDAALLIFSVLIAAYVVVGGLKGVMYTDALQGSIMFVGMIFLLVWTYSLLGGVTEAHTALTEIGNKPSLFGSIGFKGWTAMPECGWGEPKYDLWWIVVSTIVLGVGIGVLAQPQLAVRFMTVKSKRELNRAVFIGGVFILIMTGVAFTVGSLSNLYFHNHEKITGKIISKTEVAWVVAKKERDILKKVPCELWHIDSTGTGEVDNTIVAQGYDLLITKDGPKTLTAGHGIKPGEGEKLIPFSVLMPKAEIVQELADGRVEIMPHATAFTRAVVGGGENWGFNPDSVIPTFVTRAMPKWFGLLFLLTLLAAAMSTLSSQFHAVGTSIGRDVYEQLTQKHGTSILITRVGIIIGIIIAVIISHYARGGYIVARATAIFFGLCASAFLPTFLGGLFFKWVTRAGAIASMVVGFLIPAFWLLFIKDKEARALGICNWLLGTDEKPVHSLLLDHPNWSVVDPVVIAVPISFLVLILVSVVSKRPDDGHLEKCFKK